MNLLPGALLAGLLASSLAQPASIEDAVRAAEAEARAGRAREALGQLDQLASRVPPGDRRRPLVLGAMAAIELRLGAHADALRHAVDAAVLFDLAGQPARAADARNTAGLASLNASRYAEAAAHFQSAVDGSRAAGEWNGHAEQLSNLGNAHYYLGRYDDAARAYAEAAAVVAAHRSERWANRRERIVLANQAALYQRLGRYADALALYRSIASDTMRPDERAQVLLNEGVLYRRLGDPYKALDTYEAARRIFAEQAHAAGQIAAVSNRGIVLALDLGRPDEAVATFTEALRLATAAANPREQLLARLYRGEGWLRWGRPTDAAADFQAAHEAAVRLNLPEEAWKALFGLGRVHRHEGRLAEARGALERAMAIIEGLRETVSLPSARADFFQDKREVYDARIALGLGQEAAAETFALLERSRARGWRDRLRIDSPADLDTIRTLLPAETVLLSYWVSAESAAVVRVTRDGAAVRTLRVPGPAIDRLLTTLRQPGNDEWRAAAAEVGAALLPPGFLTGARHVIVVPDGVLGLVPFDVLPVEGVPLVARAAVRLIPTAAVLAAAGASARATWRAPWTLMLAAFGQPMPGADTWAGDDAARLPASAREVEAVAARVGGRRRRFIGPANTKVHLGEVLAARPVILHLATHGVADLASAERSRLMFSPTGTGAPAGSWFLREVYDAPLTGVELAVLSACDTERGPVMRGEGVQGFSRALLAAGARSAVTTLWRVPDQAAAALMPLFYDALQQGHPRAEALALAKRAVMALPVLSHPHYWAGFVLSGDDGPVPRAPRAETMAGAALIAAGLGLALVGLQRRR